MLAILNRKIWLIFILLITTSAIADNVKIQTVKFWETATVKDIEIEIANGADLSLLVWHKKSLLFVALEHNPNPDVISLLMDQGMDPFTKDGSGYDGLYYLKRNQVLNQTHIPQALLEKQKSSSRLLMIIAIAVIIFGILGTLYYYKRKRKLEHGF